MAIGVLLASAKGSQSVGDLSVELAQSLPYVRAVPDPIAAGGKPGVWIGAETAMDLESDSPILPGTLQQFLAVVIAGTRQIFRDHPGVYGLPTPTGIQGTHVREP